MAPTSHICPLAIVIDPTLYSRNPFAFQTLRVLDFRGMDKEITAAHLTEVGSLPALQSVATDMVGWDGVELTSVARQGLFRILTDLKTNAAPARLYRNVFEHWSVHRGKMGGNYAQRRHIVRHYALHWGTLGYYAPAFGYPPNRRQS
jgi:hypothetical protein